MPPTNEIEVRLFDPSYRQIWDEYVKAHPDGTHCHLSGWKEIIEKAYGHTTYYLMASYPQAGSIQKAAIPSGEAQGLSPNSGELAEPRSKIFGILPLVHFRSLFLGCSLVSMPFLNYGGILADDERVGAALLHKAEEIKKRTKAQAIELRHISPIPWLTENKGTEQPDLQYAKRNETEKERPEFLVSTHKVRMLLRLRESGESLFKSYNSKLRSQIQRSRKEGMEVKIGGTELLAPFYDVFAANMRDLGSPVHGKIFFKEILKIFGNGVKIGVVKHEGQPVAGGIILSFKDVMEIPWASSLRKYNKWSPNMLLYWSFLEYSANGGFSFFDFGRSSPGEGTFNFKKQWGAEPILLHWYRFGRPSGKADLLTNGAENSKKKIAALWGRLPISVANLVGPRIRAQIPL